MNRIDIVVDEKLRLDVNPQERRLKKLKEACENFEALFIYYLFREMKKTVHDEYDLLGGYTGKEIYESMLLDAMSREAAKREEFGISKMLFESLKAKVLSRSSEKKPGGVRHEDKNGH